MTDRLLARFVTSAAFLLYSVALIVVAVYPLDEWHIIEIIITVLGVLAIVYLISQLLPMFTLPGERYAYLIVGCVGVLTVLTYALRSSQEDYVKAEVILLMCAGIVGSYGSYLTMGRYRSGQVRSGS